MEHCLRETRFSHGGNRGGERSISNRRIGLTFAWVQVTESAKRRLAITAANIFFGRPATALKFDRCDGNEWQRTTTTFADRFDLTRFQEPRLDCSARSAITRRAGNIRAPNTTPESVDLQNFFAVRNSRRPAESYATMEASSHALALDRLWGCHFAHRGLYQPDRATTSIFHKNFEKLFRGQNGRLVLKEPGRGEPDFSIINTDDEWGKKKLAGLGKKRR